MIEVGADWSGAAAGRQCVWRTQCKRDRRGHDNSKARKIQVSVVFCRVESRSRSMSYTVSISIVFVALRLVRHGHVQKLETSCNVWKHPIVDTVYAWTTGTNAHAHSHVYPLYHQLESLQPRILYVSQRNVFSNRDLITVVCLCVCAQVVAEPEKEQDGHMGVDPKKCGNSMKAANVRTQCRMETREKRKRAGGQEERTEPTLVNLEKNPWDSCLDCKRGWSAKRFVELNNMKGPNWNIPWSIIHFHHWKCHRGRCDIWCDICDILWNLTITKKKILNPFSRRRHKFLFLRTGSFQYIKTAR